MKAPHRIQHDELGNAFLVQLDSDSCAVCFRRGLGQKPEHWCVLKSWGMSYPGRIPETYSAVVDDFGDLVAVSLPQ